jgi:hypothetical protein
MNAASTPLSSLNGVYVSSTIHATPENRSGLSQCVPLPPSDDDLPDSSASNPQFSLWRRACAALLVFERLYHLSFKTSAE